MAERPGVSGDGVAAQRGLVFTYLIIARGDSMRDVIFGLIDIA